MDEIERRKATIAARQTDVERWKNPRQLEAAWEARAAVAAQLIPAGAGVADIGCGAMRLEGHLPFGCSYAPSDVVARDARTVVADLNGEGLPPGFLESADIVSMLGVWEYLYAPEKTFAALAASGRALVTSYCPTELSTQMDRRALGWVNDLSVSEFVALAARHGYRVAVGRQIDPVQYLFKFVRAEPFTAPARKPVHVLSYFNVGNFGDRLGFHLINDVLPPHAEVSWGTFKPFTELPPDIDLLVIGFGNSLFDQLLTEPLLATTKNAKATIGIFGTQYREQLPRQMLDRLLDSLTHWFARYEDDILFYGRNRTNVSHLGDWLINAFPMAVPTVARPVTIGKEIWNELPLDRTIQFIQMHRKVMSERIHPLLCALTSAEEVAYREQRESGAGDLVSGKFRSMFLDIFEQTFPEGTFWKVDRQRVVDYKAKVRRNTEELRARLAQLLA
jgi:hypothetical protein